MIKQKAVEEKEEVAANEYISDDFVSMDQYVMKTPGCLPASYGRECPSDRYHGGTIFNGAASDIIRVEIKCYWVIWKPLFPRLDLSSEFGN